MEEGEWDAYFSYIFFPVLAEEERKRMLLAVKLHQNQRRGDSPFHALEILMWGSVLRVLLEWS